MVNIDVPSYFVILNTADSILVKIENMFPVHNQVHSENTFVDLLDQICY